MLLIPMAFIIATCCASLELGTAFRIQPMNCAKQTPRSFVGAPLTENIVLLPPPFHEKKRKPTFSTTLSTRR
jgi:hypothetical protein